MKCLKLVSLLSAYFFFSLTLSLTALLINSPPAAPIISPTGTECGPNTGLYSCHVAEATTGDPGRDN